MIKIKVEDSKRRVVAEPTGNLIFDCKAQSQTISKIVVDGEKIYILTNGGDILTDYNLFCMSSTGELLWSTEHKLKPDDCAIIDFSIEKTKVFGLKLFEKIEAWSLNTVYQFSSRGKLTNTQMNK